jgi:hypothetical protein
MDALVHHQVVSQVILLRSSIALVLYRLKYSYIAVLSPLPLFTFYCLQVISTVMVHEAYLIVT